MTNRAAAKGAEAEREAAGILASLLGFDIKRKLGAGRAEDTGDLYGLPDAVVQVAWWPKKGPLQAVRVKPLEAELQRENDGATFAVSMVRLHGGVWRMVMTPEQFSTLYREAIADTGPGARWGAGSPSVELMRRG